MTACDSSNNVVDLEFQDKNIGSYNCSTKEFKITDKSSGKPYNSFEYEKLYNESEFVKRFTQAGETRANAESTFSSIKALRSSEC